MLTAQPEELDLVTVDGDAQRPADADATPVSDVSPVTLRIDSRASAMLAQMTDREPHELVGFGD